MDINILDRIQTTTHGNVTGTVTLIEPIRANSIRGRLIHFTTRDGETDAEYEQFIVKIGQNAPRCEACGADAGKGCAPRCANTSR